MRLRDYPMTRPIARRTLDYQPKKGPHGKIVLQVGRPARAEVDWYCPYRISGMGKEKVFPVFGGDSLQALTLALDGLAADVILFNEREKALSWGGGRWLGLELPRVLEEARRKSRRRR